MNKITFDQFLRANGLPPVGEKLTTPNGDVVWVERYVFDEYEDRVEIGLKSNGYVISWLYSQVKECTWEGKDETVFD